MVNPDIRNRSGTRRNTGSCAVLRTGLTLLPQVALLCSTPGWAVQPSVEQPAAEHTGAAKYSPPPNSSRSTPASSRTGSTEAQGSAGSASAAGSTTAGSTSTGDSANPKEPQPASSKDADEPGWHDEEPAEPAEGRRVRDATRYRSAQRGAVEFRFGPYRPNVDHEFNGTATPFQDLFGTGPSVGIAIEGDWQVLRIPHFGTFGPGFSIGYVRYDAGSLVTADPTQRSAQPTSMWIVPTYGVGVLRVDVLAIEFNIPIVPYVKGGVAHNMWETNDAGQRSEINGESGRGNEVGIVGMFGGMLLLDFFAPQAAIDMDNITGVNHAYLFGEWMISEVSRFGSGLQTGTNTWQVGVALEF